MRRRMFISRPPPTRSETRPSRGWTSSRRDCWSWPRKTLTTRSPSMLWSRWSTTRSGWRATPRTRAGARTARKNGPPHYQDAQHDPLGAVTPNGMALGGADGVAVAGLAVDLLALVAVHGVIAGQGDREVASGGRIMAGPSLSDHGVMSQPSW